MSLKIAWKQNILVTDFHQLKLLLVVFGFGSQTNVCGFSRQNICSVGLLNSKFKFLVYIQKVKVWKLTHWENVGCTAKFLRSHAFECFLLENLFVIMSNKQNYSFAKCYFYLPHGIEQPIFRIPNLKYLQRNFVYLLERR